jgi:hypothetical protein
MGQLGLSTNGTINLGASSVVVRFADSSALNWDSNSRLVIEGWNGSSSENGPNQVYFGNSSSGLTPAQLSQIQFRTGSSTNLYSAKILSTGEVVPDTASVPGVMVSHKGNNLILTWPTGWSIQTATNVPGPYFDIPGATPPYTNDMPFQQQQFFRLWQGTQ